MARSSPTGWGSVVHNGVRPQSYYPYGEEKSTITESNQDRFATYYRDAFTNFDYAMQRYYHSGSGRFLTPDPYRASAGPADPGSWNRYAYVQGDPVNFNDPSGLCMAFVDPFGDPGGGGWWSGIYSMPVWGPEGYMGSYFVFPTDNPAVPSPNSGGGGASGGYRRAKFQRDMKAAKANWGQVSKSIREAVPSGSRFTPQMIDCMAGLEATWDPNRDGLRPAAGRTGLFQYNQASWEGEYGNGIPWSVEAARNIQTSVAVKLAGLDTRLAIIQKRRPDLNTFSEQIARAITLSGDEPRFGDAYGAAILDCANNIDSDFVAGFRAIWNLLNP